MQALTVHTLARDGLNCKQRKGVKLNTIQDRQSGTYRSVGRRAQQALLTALGAALLSGCQQVKQNLSIADLESHYNKEILWMGMWAIVLSIIIFIGVSVALFYTVQKFREDRNDAPPQQFHGNDKLESLLVGVPILIVIFLSVITVRSMAILNPVNDKNAKITVYAKQFWWNFGYPATVSDAGGVVTNGNEMIMPTKQGVTLDMTSGDVIHGFWAPNIGGQRAAMPSVQKSWTVDTDRQAVYQGNCTQLCGASHANMRYKVIALDTDRYNSFLAAAKAYKAPQPAPGSAEARGYALFMQGKASSGALACASCHRVQGTPANGAAAPDLSFFGTRRTLGAGVWEAMTATHWQEPQAKVALHEWIKHSPKVKPGSLMPTYDGSEYMVKGQMVKGGTLSDPEIDDIASYLGSLKLPEVADYWKDVPVYGTPAGGSQ